MNKLIEFKSLELHVKEVKNRGNQIKNETMNINYETLILNKMIFLKIKKKKQNTTILEINFQNATHL